MSKSGRMMSIYSPGDMIKAIKNTTGTAIAVSGLQLYYNFRHI